jgi:catechol 2,3-dioxygenase-like lactoylglutathione lyase family enzyme
MNPAYVEHVNITVKDLDKTVAFILAALPDWRIRGQGAADWFGKPARWLHVGTDASYLALMDGGEGTGLRWTGHQVGMKHVGIVVPDVQAVVERLAAAGHALDHWGGEHPFRRSIYFIERDELQFEFVEYRSNAPAERNDYAR